ncbi:MAG: HIT family protein [Patescibacteria group bacterium]
MDCVFCKIVKDEIPSYKVYEDQDILAFLDIQPLTQGHTLVIPKKHCQDIFDIGESDLQKVIVSAKNVSEKIKNTLKADGIRISQSNGKAAGQDVMHFHLHVIPRYTDNGLSNNPTLTTHLPKAGSDELLKVQEKIKM